MASASKVIDEIVEQGEGATGESKGEKKVLFSELEKVAHYFRFSEIYHERYYQAGDDPQVPPTERKCWLILRMSSYKA